MKKQKTILKCRFCGKDFYPISGSLKQQFCSKKCCYLGRKVGGKKGKKYPHLQRARIGRCLLCGKKFRAVNDFSNIKQKWCSKECWLKRNPPSNKKCLYCKKEFITYQRNKIYCCQKCRNMDYRIRMKGSNSHFWKGGKTQASKIKRTCAEYKEWRDEVFKRDNWTCQECGKRSKAGERIILHAHHIKHFSEHLDLIYKVDNGITLCFACHQLKHKNIKLTKKDYTGQKAKKVA